MVLARTLVLGCLRIVGQTSRATNQSPQITGSPSFGLRPCLRPNQMSTNFSARTHQLSTFALFNISTLKDNLLKSPQKAITVNPALQ
ncbi:hypothetical protein EDB82DRAFT_529853 [Fusarium venenatum]|uniref:uncharacterized protein n=1 Tax=Fusarium venenatum TaxID=56646 RepID=UPI001E031539|nr:hypothetical protein EDB82DRAFT_529853 [Fusarium venenatum]